MRFGVTLIGDAKSWNARVAQVVPLNDVNVAGNITVNTDASVANDSIQFTGANIQVTPLRLTQRAIPNRRAYRQAEWRRGLATINVNVRIPTSDADDRCVLRESDGLGDFARPCRGNQGTAGGIRRFISPLRVPRTSPCFLRPRQPNEPARLANRLASFQARCAVEFAQCEC